MEINTDKLMVKFDDMKKYTSNIEWRSARDLQTLLWYIDRRNFLLVINKAKQSCNTSWNDVTDHFVDINKMVKLWSWSTREIDDFMLSRYACYLIAQNGDPKKYEIAFAQAYFATQTRKSEILEQYMVDYQRILSREKLRNTEKQFQELAFERWVDGDWISRIRSKWDSVLFWWMTTQQMKDKYKIKNGPLADYLPEVTIKAKDLATEVTNFNMKKHDLKWEKQIWQEHEKNNKWVREYLISNWITPEELPPEIDIKKIERQQNKTVKSLSKNSFK